MTNLATIVGRHMIGGFACGTDTVMALQAAGKNGCVIHSRRCPKVGGIVAVIATIIRGDV